MKAVFLNLLFILENEIFLLYSRQNEIRGADLKQPYYYTVPPISVPNVYLPTHLSFDASSKYIYWIDSQMKEVRRAPIIGGSIESIINTGLLISTKTYIYVKLFTNF